VEVLISNCLPEAGIDIFGKIVEARKNPSGKQAFQADFFAALRSAE
jgi:hypothetical protein